MGYLYESGETHRGLPVKGILHRVDSFEPHWHKEIEILMVLKGSINISIGNEKYTLKEEDLILINKNEIHSIYRTQEDNILLAVQINTTCYTHCYPNLNKLHITCNSVNSKKEDRPKFNRIKEHLAKIEWEFNKKREAYQLIIGSETHLLLADLVNQFECTVNEHPAISSEKEIRRIQGIIEYINSNIEGGISLQEVADNQNISIYYLSHFFKKKMGYSFQEYINYVRLDKAVTLLTTTELKITEIAYSSGFPNGKALNTCFKETYLCTPTEFRKKHGNSGVNREGKLDKLRAATYLDVDRNNALEILFQYLKVSDNNEMNDRDTADVFIEISENTHMKEFRPFWRKLTGFGKASDGLKEEVRNQLRKLEGEIGFEYVRFHGIFCDDMSIIHFNEKGEVIYSWYYIDKLFDFFQEIHVKPFIELGFMPSEFARSDETVFAWKGNITMAKHISLWTGLVKEFIKHCINRYGSREVETWYFEVWNQPDFEGIFWVGGMENYFEFYKETALAVKSISPALKVGGPAIAYQTVMETGWLEEFLQYTVTWRVPLDFVSVHVYSEVYDSKNPVDDISPETEGRDHSSEYNPSLLKRKDGSPKIYYSKDHTYNITVLTKQKIDQILSDEPELHITEWNVSSYGRNLINDTCFMAAFIIYNVLRLNGKAGSLGFWTFTDILDEQKVGISAFHGGLGLFNKDGIKKPAYYAYYFLSKLGQKIIDQGEDYIVTKEQENIQILVYNYAYFDNLFLRGDISLLSNENRYRSFEEKPDKKVNIKLNGITGRYKQTEYKLDREHGSAVDQWIKMGAPESMSRDEIEYLKGKSQPEILVKVKDCSGTYSESLLVPVHGMVLIVLEHLK